ncbi:hypothetical protein GQ457_02G025360 [Hibiscus cannabinus]
MTSSASSLVSRLSLSRTFILDSGSDARICRRSSRSFRNILRTILDGMVIPTTSIAQVRLNLTDNTEFSHIFLDGLVALLKMQEILAPMSRILITDVFLLELFYKETPCDFFSWSSQGRDIALVDSENLGHSELPEEAQFVLEVVQDFKVQLV